MEISKINKAITTEYNNVFPQIKDVFELKIGGEEIERPADFRTFNKTIEASWDELKALGFSDLTEQHEFAGEIIDSNDESHKFIISDVLWNSNREVAESAYKSNKATTWSVKTQSSFDAIYISEIISVATRKDSKENVVENTITE